jgi:hypothetical protein
MTTAQPPAVRAYLDELRYLLAEAPDRDLVVDGVSRHIEDALAGGVDDASVQAVLAELGDPALIAAETAPAPRGRPPFLERRAGMVLTVLLLAIGGIVFPVAGWLVGVGLLWGSKGWRRIDKVVGTFTIPVVLAVVVTIGTAIWNVSRSGEAADQFGFPSHVVLLALFPILDTAVAVFLALRFRASR